MKKFTRKKNYKAREPEETVSMIRKILEDCRIEVEEIQKKSEDPGVFSSRLFLKGEVLSFGSFGTNGKGMTREYSRASAYAELMERLQNFMIFGDYAEDAYNKGMTKYFVAPDEVMMNEAEAFNTCGDILCTIMRMDQNGIRPFLEENGTSMPCVAFKNIVDGNGILLPHKTLRMVTGSNGMAAGNNYKESITQGLSEIYERAAVREAYEKNPKIKQIRPECFEGNEILEKLDDMKKKGYGYKILDLSMEKNYPVVGLLLEKDGKKAFKAGADPCPVTALERCLTEIFQGNTEENWDMFKSNCCRPFPATRDFDIRWDISDQEIAFLSDGTGMIADCLFNPSEIYNDGFAGTDGESEEADFEYMVTLTKSLGYDIFVRDCSFLGFPSYQIIVPELSNFDLVYEDGLDIYKWSFQKIEFRSDRLTACCAEILNRLFEKYEDFVKNQK